MNEIQNDQEKFCRLEEIKTRQRSRERNIVAGDRNTAYFQAVANQRKRKNKAILSIDGPYGVVTETLEMLKVAGNFYKSLFFGAEEMLDAHLDNFWDECD